MVLNEIIKKSVFAVFDQLGTYYPEATYCKALTYVTAHVIRQRAEYIYMNYL